MSENEGRRTSTAPLPPRVPKRTEGQYLKIVVNILLSLAMARDWMSRAQVHGSVRELAPESAEVGYHLDLLANRGYIESESAQRRGKVGVAYRLIKAPNSETVMPPRIPDGVLIDPDRVDAIEEKLRAILKMMREGSENPATLLALVREYAPDKLKRIEAQVKRELLEAYEVMKVALTDARAEGEIKAWLDEHAAFAKRHVQLMGMKNVRLEVVAQHWEKAYNQDPAGWDRYFSLLAEAHPAVARFRRVLEGGDYADLLKSAGSGDSQDPPPSKS